MANSVSVTHLGDDAVLILGAFDAAGVEDDVIAGGITIRMVVTSGASAGYAFLVDDDSMTIGTDADIKLSHAAGGNESYYFNQSFSNGLCLGASSGLDGTGNATMNIAVYGTV